MHEWTSQNLSMSTSCSRHKLAHNVFHEWIMLSPEIPSLADSVLISDVCSLLKYMQAWSQFKTCCWPLLPGWDTVGLGPGLHACPWVSGWALWQVHWLVDTVKLDNILVRYCSVWNNPVRRGALSLSKQDVTLSFPAYFPIVSVTYILPYAILNPLITASEYSLDHRLFNLHPLSKGIISP